ncbi:uncharacterized protein LOC117109043 [Anneissia japonica]|uniref:uncharacterized protein LOC117109043 n=1 Tax=Anneissia japonica TaxID=1529436 RepID=UPI00142557F3|nr:uncharacterized protein LOC117109043 [Anneissia japonica]
MEVNLGEKELQRAQSYLEEERKTMMRLKSAIEDLKKDQTRHSEVLRENRNLKEDVEANARRIEWIDDELRASKRMLGDRDRLISDKDRATTNLKKEIADLRDELLAGKGQGGNSHEGSQRREISRRTSCRNGKAGNSFQGTQRRRRKTFGDSRKDKRGSATGDSRSGDFQRQLTTIGREEVGREREGGRQSEGMVGCNGEESRSEPSRTEVAVLKEKLAEAARKESLLRKDVEKLTALKDENEKESRRMEKQHSDKDRTAIDLRNEIDTMEEKMKQNGSKTDDQKTAYKEEIERNMKRMKELDATIAKKIREAVGLEDEISVLKEGKEFDRRKINVLGCTSLTRDARRPFSKTR